MCWGGPGALRCYLSHCCAVSGAGRSDLPMVMISMV